MHGENDTQFPSRYDLDDDLPSRHPISGSHLSLWYLTRGRRKLLGHCLALCSTVFLHGYEFVITAAVASTPAFQYTYGRKQSNAYIIPAAWLALWSAAGPIGIMVGSLTGGRLQDRYGRRSSLALGSLLSIVAAALCFVSDRPDEIDSRRGVFLAGKLLQGFAIGMLICMSQTYMSEVLPTTLRGPTIALLPMFTLFGQLIGAIIIHFSSKSGSSDYYRTAFASQWVVSVFTLTCAVFLPESPAWLLRVNEVCKAQKSKRRLNLAEEDMDAPSSAPMDSNDTSFLQCFQDVHRRRTIIVSFSSVLPQLFGLTLFSHASYFLGMVGMPAQTSLIFLILGILLGLLSTFASIWSVKQFGRRILSLSSLGAASVLWLSMGVVGCFPGDFKIWYTAISMMVIVIVCTAGVWPASHVIASEASSLPLRAKSQAIGWFSFGLAATAFSIFLPYIYNADRGNLKAKTGFVMAAFTVVGFVGTYLALPEMKDRSPSQIDRMFELDLPTKDFKSWEEDERSIGWPGTPHDYVTGPHDNSDEACVLVTRHRT